MFVPVLLRAQDPFQHLAAAIQQKADSMRSAEALPGIMIGLSDQQGTRYFDFGFADPEQAQVFDANTIFEAGSITKTFTAYILESVLKDYGISDEAAMLDYLPPPVRANKRLATISFKSLLNHCSGLPRLPENLQVAGLQPYANYNLDSLYHYLAKARPRPGSQPLYSNLGAGLAGVLAQRISGRNYQQLLATYIYRPFDMDDVAADSSYPRSVGYMTGKVPYWTMNVLYPAGGLRTNTRQLLRYLKVMAQPSGSVDTALIAYLLQPTVSVNPSIQIGLGWHLLRLQGHPPIYWHNGGTYGFSTFAAFVAGTAKAVVVVINQFDKNNCSDGLGIFIMKKLLELP
ncbi:hypothetical protein GCM10027051_18850 [Niabella terrae]